MKKALLITAAIVLYFTNSYSQSLNFGVKAGVNLNRLTGYQDVNQSNIVGFVGGVFLRAKLLGFYLQPELVFSQKGGKYSGGIAATTTTSAVSFTRTEKLYNMDVPVLFGKKFFKVLRINAGPVFRYQIAEKEDIAINPPSVQPKTEFNRAGVGFQAGLGVDLWKLNFDLRYDGNISHVVKEKSIQFHVYQFTVGFLF